MLKGPASGLAPLEGCLVIAGDLFWEPCRKERCYPQRGKIG